MMFDTNKVALLYLLAFPIAVWFLAGSRMFLLNFPEVFNNVKDYWKIGKCAVGLAFVFTSVYSLRILLDYIEKG